LDVGDNVPSASTSATSFVTPRTERFSRRRVSGIHIPRTLVRYHAHMPLSTSIERTVQTAVRRLGIGLPRVGGASRYQLSDHVILLKMR
jgi:hypothetical protein